MTAPRTTAAALEAWFEQAARDLPWRRAAPGERRDPYRAFVSEAMLQQTQVSRVLEKFGPFIERFPTVQALAEAEEADVLTMWSGLGYYRRARNLHAAARRIVDTHAGEIPSDPDELRALPGVGRYTAGSIASIVFGVRTPIVDGNVQRVFVRLHGKELRLGGRDTEAWAWERAGEFVDAARDPGVANEALMELGATVCKPKGAVCVRCPLAGECAAAKRGLQESLPLPKDKAKRKPVWHAVLLVQDGERVLAERRPETGLWAGLWQPPTIERDDRAPTESEIESWAGFRVEEAGRTSFVTTHRGVEFARWIPRLGAQPKLKEGQRWLSEADLREVALSNAHRAQFEWAFEHLGANPGTR